MLTMKTFLAICAAAASAVVVSVTPVAAQEIHMTAALTGAEETPAPGVLTGAAGTAQVTLDTVNKSVTVELQVLNLPSASTAGHIHVGPRGLAGPVVIDFAFPSGRTGDFGLLFRLTSRDFRPRPEIGIVTIDDAIQAIAAGNAYVNVHTTAFPGGEIRGQLVPAP
jgi:hypothetical protein